MIALLPMELFTRGRATSGGRVQIRGGEAARFCERPVWWRDHMVAWEPMELFTRDATFSATRRDCGEMESTQADKSDFDIELFIIEVQSRPALWDLNDEKYCNRDLKRKNWEELVTIFLQKEDASAAEKNEFAQLHA